MTLCVTTVQVVLATFITGVAVLSYPKYQEELRVCDVLREKKIEQSHFVLGNICNSWENRVRAGSLVNCEQAEVDNHALSNDRSSCAYNASVNTAHHLLASVSRLATPTTWASGAALLVSVSVLTLVVAAALRISGYWQIRAWQEANRNYYAPVAQQRGECVLRLDDSGGGGGGNKGKGGGKAALGYYGQYEQYGQYGQYGDTTGCYTDDEDDDY